MWGQAVLFVLFSLLLRGHQGNDCSDSTLDVASISGKPLWLQPSNIQTKSSYAEWKKIQGDSSGKAAEILVSYQYQQKPPTFNNFSNNTYDFNASNFALGIKSAKMQDSGNYSLEVTNNNGTICTKKFQILIQDPVEEPNLSDEWKTWANGSCQLSLYCFVSKNDKVSYALYKGSELISKQGNFTYWENQTADSSPHTYTCTVSNEVSSANRTQNFTWGCHSILPKSRFLPLVVTIVILVILFFTAVTYYCMWDKKRKQSKIGPQEESTIYEYVKVPQVGQNQIGHSRASGSPSATQGNERGHRKADRPLFEEQVPKQKPPGAGETIYSMVQYKPSDPTSQEKRTLYSVIQPSRKSGSKQRQQNFSSDCTLYEEVGKQCLNVHNPARLSRRQLENFDIYS
ncbi:natural killer cell receptor 2B4 [Sigmodon hispidus]